MTLAHHAQRAGLAVGIVAIALGAIGCKLAEKVAKSQKHAAIAYDEKTGG
jgi:hypothetical protein